MLHKSIVYLLRRKKLIKDLKLVIKISYLTNHLKFLLLQPKNTLKRLAISLV